MVHDSLGNTITSLLGRSLAAIDADLWTYDIAFACQPRGMELLPFAVARSFIERRIDEVLSATGCDCFTMYLTGRNNFRDSVATERTYKGGRLRDKPYHYHNIRNYLMGLYGARVCDGWEADDEITALMAGDSFAIARLTERESAKGRGSPELPSGVESGLPKKVVCVSRDKDLRQAQGWHYSYPCGNQPEIPLMCVDPLGSLELNKDRTKIKGTGLKFFYAQTLVGDSTDNYGGLYRYGAVRAYDLLSPCTDEEQMFRAVYGEYAARYDNPAERLLEQGRLAWMTREFRDGQPVMWEFPFEVSE